MLWIVEVEDAKRIDDLITLPDSENLDLKIASGLRKILAGNFEKQVTSANGKAQSEKRSLTGRQTAWSE